MNHARKVPRTISLRGALIFVGCLISLFMIIYGVTIVVVQTDPSVNTEIFAVILIQAGGALFFSLTFGVFLQYLRTRHDAQVIGDLFSEFGNAGLVKFYANRRGDAQENLEAAFRKHKRGEIKIIGVSLRAFLTEGGYLNDSIQENMDRYVTRGVHIKAIICNLEKNRSLAIRSFIEEFNPDGSLPKQGEKRRKYDDEDCHVDFSAFCEKYLLEYGRGSNQNTRVITDLENVESSVANLNARTEQDCISLRRSLFAPYFTCIIFPDKCYFTPNILFTDAPANMPMLVFAKGDVYNKILTHFEFCWWAGEPVP